MFPYVLPNMTCRKHAQPSLWDGLLTAEVADLWEPWMRQIDKLLDDDELLDSVYEAQGGVTSRNGKIVR